MFYKHDNDPFWEIEFIKVRQRPSCHAPGKPVVERGKKKHSDEHSPNIVMSGNISASWRCGLQSCALPSRSGWELFTGQSSYFLARPFPLSLVGSSLHEIEIDKTFNAPRNGRWLADWFAGTLRNRRRQANTRAISRAWPSLPPPPLARQGWQMYRNVCCSCWIEWNS